jgi:hypothetical protein
MADNPTRPEATHRQRAALSTVPDVFVGADGRRYAFLSNSASDLLPTVQFGNVLVGPVTIARMVPVDPTPEEAKQLDAEMVGLIERSRKQQQAAEAVAGAERRIIQWAIDPSKKVLNPATGAEMAPSAPAPPQPPAPPAPPAAPAAAPAQPVEQPTVPAQAPATAASFE